MGDYPEAHDQEGRQRRHTPGQGAGSLRRRGTRAVGVSLVFNAGLIILKFCKSARLRAHGKSARSDRELEAPLQQAPRRTESGTRQWQT